MFCTELWQTDFPLKHVHTEKCISLWRKSEEAFTLLGSMGMNIFGWNYTKQCFIFRENGCDFLGPVSPGAAPVRNSCLSNYSARRGRARGRPGGTLQFPLHHRAVASARSDRCLSAGVPAPAPAAQGASGRTFSSRRRPAYSPPAAAPSVRHVQYHGTVEVSALRDIQDTGSRCVCQSSALHVVFSSYLCLSVEEGNVLLHGYVLSLCSSTQRTQACGRTCG